jgi:hypothetical protein
VEGCEVTSVKGRKALFLTNNKVLLLVTEFSYQKLEERLGPVEQTFASPLRAGVPSSL